jgi:hypothetical protein
VHGRLRVYVDAVDALRAQIHARQEMERLAHRHISACQAWNKATQSVGTRQQKAAVERRRQCERVKVSVVPPGLLQRPEARREPAALAHASQQHYPASFQRACNP